MEEENFHKYKKGWKAVGIWLKTLMIDKLEAGSEAFLMIKRNESGIKGWAEVYRYYMEMSGMGLNSKLAAMMKPKAAGKDEEVLKCIETWEEYRDALERGMMELPDHTR